MVEDSENGWEMERLLKCAGFVNCSDSPWAESNASGV